MRNISYAIILLCLAESLQAQNKDMLDVKIGQMLMIGVPKTEVDPLVMEEVKSGKVGAIILFEKNVPKGTSSFAPLKKIYGPIKRKLLFHCW